ncbi:MAG: xanthine dehydrogenase family protein molybdopterin-binding subunit [Betaproteobacteria bacterium]|nr:xanthine dehydrogenase family protein molybdopterin-binding subunit [Betaproteobacteria bacterium]
MTSAQIGRSAERREDARFLSGQSCFVADIQRPGMLHAVAVRSEVAHALIRGIDVSSALALPGVVAVIRGEDIEGELKRIPLHKFTPIPGIDRFAQWPIARDRTVYVGEPVALVIAENHHLAEDAAELVAVDYETLDPVVDMQASKSDRTVIHPSVGTNIATNYRVEKGDAAAAFARAAYTRKETFKVHRHTASPMETRGLVAEWDAQAVRMRVWGPTKLLFANRAILASMLGLPELQVEMLEVDVGGSFGVRGEFYPEDFLVPYAARKLGRPVKWIEDRREHLIATNHCREMQCTLEIAVDQDGIILALRGDVMADLGAYARPNGGVAPSRCLQFMCGPYRIRNADFTLTALITNKTPFGSYRGPGRYESCYFRERLVDIAAADLGIDAAEFRMRNLIPPESMPWDSGSLLPGGAKAVYDTGNYPSVMKQALEAFGYPSLASLRGKKKDGRLHGVGIGCFIESTGAGQSETVRLLVTDTGRLNLYTGSSSAGQSHETVQAQVLADELAFPFEDIDVFHGSTTYVEGGWGTYASRSAVMAGTAITLSVKKLRKQVLELLEQRADIPVDALDWEPGSIIRGPDGKVVASLAELGKQAASDPELRRALEASETYASTQLTYTFGVQLAHVAVDPETAAIEVVRFLTMEDVGRMINPAVVHGQTLGASMQGISATLLDHLIYDPSGQLLTGSFADYVFAGTTDFPNIEAISLEQSKSLSNPLGIKGAGEGGIAATGGAIANAVEDALRSLGVSVRELPLSPDKLAAMMRQARSSKLATAA